MFETLKITFRALWKLAERKLQLDLVPLGGLVQVVEDLLDDLERRVFDEWPREVLDANGSRNE